MIQAANRRLRRMTKGTFELQCRGLADLGKQGEVGLDLDVYSFVTDRVRDVKTLSGGESFLAALAMALGMADVIQNAAGSVKVDAMFIDEGFGSLDEESRTRAVQVLQELSGGRRLIGIISHVTELKEEMGHKLVVKKGNGGSQVHWEIED
ncbi:MAG: SbcC/MukB-like Walker B domain-containing protein [Clostridium fessum]